jgi:hypothetical protein
MMQTIAYNKDALLRGMLGLQGDHFAIQCQAKVAVLGTRKHLG